MDLYLVRHAIAEARDPARWPDDSVRPLTEDGISLFRKAARGLVRAGAEVEVAFTSPYVRAWQTAEILTHEAGWPQARKERALEPGTSPSVAIELVRSHREPSVALVGHQPDLSELASLLLTGGREARLELKKGGVIWLRFEGDPAPGTAFLRGSLSPKVLRRLGS
jgi:phosphohistidine phosphatase